MASSRRLSKLPGARLTGSKIHKLKHIKLHAKLDGELHLEFVARQPWLRQLRRRRELAIQVSDEHITLRIHKTLQEDWAHSDSLDLSDEGLFAELKEKTIETYERILPSKQANIRGTIERQEL